MPSQTEKGLGALGLNVLSEVSLIHHQHTPTLGRLLR